VGKELLVTFVLAENVDRRDETPTDGLHKFAMARLVTPPWIKIKNPRYSQKKAEWIYSNEQDKTMQDAQL
jgi:hypothetical protein